MTTEASIESSWQRRTKKYGWQTIKLDTGRSSRGWPDRLICLPNGKAIFIEFKTPKGKVTPLQNHMHEKLRKLGHVVWVSRSAAHAEQICLYEAGLVSEKPPEN